MTPAAIHPSASACPPSRRHGHSEPENPRLPQCPPPASRIPAQRSHPRARLPAASVLAGRQGERPSSQAVPFPARCRYFCRAGDARCRPNILPRYGRARRPFSRLPQPCAAPRPAELSLGRSSRPRRLRRCRGRRSGPAEAPARPSLSGGRPCRPSRPGTAAPGSAPAPGPGLVGPYPLPALGMASALRLSPRQS